MKVRPIAWTTGPEATNQTVTRASVGGTDLGILWDDGRGGVLSVWGDTFADGPPQQGTGGTRWRSNVLARSTNRDVSERGVVLDWWITEPTEPGVAREVVHRDGPEDFTTIPTSGLAVRGFQYMTYMAVREWLTAGRWTTNYAGIAWSADGGATWVKDPHARWRNSPAFDQGWQMCALTAGGDGHVHLFGTPNGRGGPARLSRVPDSRVLDLDAYEYWTGTAWSPWPADAAVVLPGPVSELSVAYHHPSSRWLAGYYHEELDAVVVRTAEALTGPWSEPSVAASATDFPGLYGFFFHPWSMTDPTPCASMSQWPPYQTQTVALELD